MMCGLRVVKVNAEEPRIGTDSLADVISPLTRRIFLTEEHNQH